MVVGVWTFWLKGVSARAEDKQSVIGERFKRNRALVVRLMWQHTFERIRERLRARHRLRGRGERSWAGSAVEALTKILSPPKAAYSRAKSWAPSAYDAAGLV